MKYAVVELQWHQYVVSEGKQIIVDRMDHNNQEVKIESVLLWFDSETWDVNVWRPFVAWAHILAEVVRDQKWDKVKVLKFHRKNRYERNYWPRAHQTVLMIKSLHIS